MKNQSSIIIGIFLILIGACFLTMQFFPTLGSAIDFDALWPIIPLGIGMIFLTFGFVSTPPMLIPGMILTGIGGILLISNTFGIWNFWQLWLLVPVFVGLGILILNIREGRGISRGIRTGGPLLAIGLVLFGVFALIQLAIFNLIWPILLIGVGFFWMVRTILRR